MEGRNVRPPAAIYGQGQELAYWGAAGSRHRLEGGWSYQTLGPPAVIHFFQLSPDSQKVPEPLKTSATAEQCSDT